MTKVPYRLLKLLIPYKGTLVLGVFCMIGVSFCSVVPPLLLKNVVDGVLINRQLWLLNLMALGVVVLYGLKGLLSYGQKLTMNAVGQGVVRTLRQQTYDHLQTLSLKFIHARNVGELLSRVTNDAVALQNCVTTVVVDLVVQGFTCLGLLVYLFYLNWQLMCYSLVIIPLAALAMNRAGSVLRKLGHQAQQKVADLSAAAEESLAAIRLVRAFATEEQEKARFAQANNENYQVVLQSVRVNALLSASVELLLISALAVILWIGGRQVLAGMMTPGELIAFLSSLGFLAAPLNSFTRAVSQVTFGVAAAERIFDLLDNDDRVISPQNALILPRLEGRVVFEDLSFRYGEQWVLRHLNLRVERGEKVALVGSTGAGKSTLVDLLQRFYDPQEGRVLVDGYDVKTVDLGSLRRQIGVVPQDCLLLKGTIRSNIAYGVEATDDQVRAAARLAGIDGFIESLPLGYDSPVGVRGVTLSGGQRQRIAIARAVVRDPRILILDEATSSLDAAVERHIQQAMDKAMEGRTALVIAHRLSTVKNADRIVFLGEGQVVQTGTHDELMARGGPYARLWNLQYGDHQ